MAEKLQLSTSIDLLKVRIQTKSIQFNLDLHVLVLVDDSRQKGRKKFLSKFKFSFSLKKHNYCSKNKTWYGTWKYWQKIAKNVKSTILSPQAMYFDQKWAKTAKTRIFPDTTLPLNDFAISEFSRHIEYDFFKEDHKNNFHTKN